MPRTCSSCPLEIFERCCFLLYDDVLLGSQNSAAAGGQGSWHCRCALHCGALLDDCSRDAAVGHYMNLPARKPPVLRHSWVNEAAVISGRKRRKCKDCGGTSICQRNCQRNICKDCVLASICEHNRWRSGAGARTAEARASASTSATLLEHPQLMKEHQGSSVSEVMPRPLWGVCSRSASNGFSRQTGRMCYSTAASDMSIPTHPDPFVAPLHLVFHLSKFGVTLQLADACALAHASMQLYSIISAHAVSHLHMHTLVHTYNSFTLSPDKFWFDLLVLNEQP